jgi:hypothetical protein
LVKDFISQFARILPQSAVLPGMNHLTIKFNLQVVSWNHLSYEEISTISVSGIIVEFESGLKNR